MLGHDCEVLDESKTMELAHRVRESKRVLDEAEQAEAEARAVWDAALNAMQDADKRYKKARAELFTEVTGETLNEWILDVGRR